MEDSEPIPFQVVALKTLRALAIMFLLPPLVLFALAHGGPGGLHLNDFLGAAFGVALLVALVVTGMAAVWTAPWLEPVRFAIGVPYLLLAIPTIPFVAFLADCSAGPCI